MILTLQSNFTADSVVLSLVSQKYFLNFQNPEGVPGITSRSQDHLMLSEAYVCTTFPGSEGGVRDSLPYLLT